MSITPTKWFRIFALAEAVSWVGLLAGMFIKYIVIENDIGVKIFGPIHGLIFIAYVLAAIFVRDHLNWNKRTLVLALTASIPPLCTVLFERWALRTGQLDTVTKKSQI